MITLIGIFKNGLVQDWEKVASEKVWWNFPKTRHIMPVMNLTVTNFPILVEDIMAYSGYMARNYEPEAWPTNFRLFYLHCYSNS
jgi:hypothetical protein